jgi:streptogramin lyase
MGHAEAAFPACRPWRKRFVTSAGAVALLASGVFVATSWYATDAGAEPIATTFTASEAPVPSNADANPMASLNGATCPNAPASCYAVGSYKDSSGHQQALIESLSGFSWTATAAMLPSNANANPEAELNGIACSGVGACTAVGDYTDNSGNEQAFVDSLSSGTWSATEALLPIAAANPSASLNGIACPASGSCVAVGEYVNPGGDPEGFFETLASDIWTPSAAFLPPGGDNGTLSAVSCPDVSDCVATGSFGTTADGDTLPLIETLASSTWSASEPPLAPDAVTSPSSSEFLELNGVSCSALGSCVAMGDYISQSGSPPGSPGILVETLASGSWTAGFNGSEDSVPLGISCPSAGSCTAVGAIGDGNGLIFQLPDDVADASPLPANSNEAPSAALSGVTCSAASNCVAVGSYEDASGDTEAFFDTDSPPALSVYTDPSIEGEGPLATAPDGSIWFVNAGSLGSISPGGTISNYPGIAAVDIAAGPDGAMWFTTDGESIGRITLAGAVTYYPDPSISGSYGIVAGPDGAMWFTTTNSIGRITMAGVTSNFTSPSIDQPWAITTGSDGALWFTNYGNRSVGRITTGGVVSGFDMPAGSNLTPSLQTITTGPDGALWIAAQNSIVRMTTSGSSTGYLGANGIYAGGDAITVGSDGAMWFTNPGDGVIGRITTSGIITNHLAPPNDGPSGITTGDDGAVWFFLNRTAIGRIPTSLFITPSTLPGAAVGSAYSNALSATNGDGPYKWTMSSGTLPPGLSLSLTGVISGTAASAGTYNFTVTANDDSTPSVPGSMAYSISVSPPAPGPYSPLPPTRICDTRAGDPSNLSGTAAQCNGLGNAGSTIAAGGTKSIAVTNNFGVPANATAVVLNVTVVNPAAPGYLTAFPTGSAPPFASNVNYVAGAVVPNLVEVGTGTSGDVSFFSSARTDIVVDVEGYVSPTSLGGAGLYTALSSPVRICDTRAGNPSGLSAPNNQCNGSGNAGMTLGMNGHPSTIDVAVAGQNGIPSGATAAVFNVTVVNATAPGFLTVFAQGAVAPFASNLNYTAGQVTSNRVMVPLSTTGATPGDISILSSSPADVVVDVSGYYTAAGGTSAQFTSEGAPVRICDTRAGNPSGLSGADNQCEGKTLGTAGTLTLNVAGLAGVPASGATAVVVNATGVSPSAPTFLTVFPDALPNPLVSDLNETPGQVRANLVVATLSATGTISIYNDAGSMDVVVDVMGWYS